MKILYVENHDGFFSREDGNEFLLEAGADAVCGKMDFDEVGATIDQLFPGEGQ